MRKISVTVTESRRVDGLLKKEFGFASSRISKIKLLEDGICLDGKRVHTDVVAHKGQILSAVIEDIGGNNPVPPYEFPIEFVYEDEDLAVYNKPEGLPTQGALELGNKTLAGALAYKWGANRSFHPVNRLDKGTSGLMVIAKSGYIHDFLRNELHTENFCRKYLAVVAGPAHPPAGNICLPIAQGEGIKRIVSSEGKPSRTDYRTVEEKNGYSLLEVIPYTGRTHQIRVHLSAVGMPLVGDWLYGEETVLSRPALHSYYVSFFHPVLGERLEFSAPLPNDMKSLFL